MAQFSNLCAEDHCNECLASTATILQHTASLRLLHISSYLYIRNTTNSITTTTYSMEEHDDIQQAQPEDHEEKCKTRLETDTVRPESTASSSSGRCGSDSSIDGNSFMGTPAPGWLLGRLFNNLATAQVQDEERASATAKLSDNLLREMVKTICELQKAKSSQADKISQLVDDVSRLSSIVRGVGRPISYDQGSRGLVPSVERATKKRVLQEGNVVHDLFATEEIDTPPKRAKNCDGNL